MMTVHLRHAFALMLSTSALVGAQAGAQTIDRSALEAVFGEPVTTSATGAPQRASDAPAAMTIITGEELRRTGARNLAEALRGHAGIDVMQVSANDYEVAIRGGSQPANPRLLVMVDGRQVYLDHYALTSWTNLGIELGEIRQIEIVRGPVSALFGFNAASGAINIVTYDPASEHVHRLSVEGGNDGQLGASAIATLRLGDHTGVRISGGYDEEDEFPTLVSVGGGKPYRGNGSVDLHHSFSSKVDARVSYSYSDSSQAILVPGFSAIAMNYVVNSTQGDVSADTGAGLLSFSGQYNQLKNNFGGGASLGIDTNFRVHMLGLRAQDIVKASPRDTIRATLEFRDDSMTLTPNLAGEISYTVASGGLMWDHRLSDRLTFNLAGRIDRLSLGQKGAINPLVSFVHGDFDRNLAAWSANAGLVFKPDDASTIRIQAARGLQAPSLVSTGIAFISPVAPGVSLGVMGNPSLDPVITDSGEIGFTHDIDPVSGKISATLFYSKTRGVVGFNSLPNQFTMAGLLMGETFMNSGSYDSYGLETSLDGEAGKHIKWRLDYTYDRIDEHFGLTSSPLTTPYDELTPRHKIGSELTFTQGPVTANIRGYLRSPLNFPMDGRTSSWTGKIDASVAVKLVSDIELYAAGDNLTGTHYIDNDFTRQSVRARIGLRWGK